MSSTLRLLLLPSFLLAVGNELYIVLLLILNFAPLDVRSSGLSDERPNSFILTPEGDWAFLNINCNGQIQYNRSVSTELIQHRNGLLDDLFPAKKGKKSVNRKARSTDGEDDTVNHFSSNEDEKEEKELSYFASKLFGDTFKNKYEGKNKKTRPALDIPDETSAAATKISLSNKQSNSSLVINDEVVGGSRHIHLNVNCPETFLGKDAFNSSVTHLIASSDGKISIGSDPLQNDGQLRYLRLWSSGELDLPLSCSWLPTSVTTLDLSHSSLHHATFSDCVAPLRTLSVAGASLKSLEICLPALKSLDASWNHLKSVTQYCPEGTSAAVELDLSQNRLKSWSSCGWPNVTHANLANNEISHLDLEKCVSHTLLELKVGQNRLSKMVTYIPSSLIILDISYNRIRKMHQVEGNLQTLLLSHNELTKLGKRPFRFAYQLFTLDLSYNGFTTLYEYYFTGLRELRSLDVSYNNLQDIKHDAFRSMRHLKKLSLVGNKLTQLDQRLMANFPRSLEFDAHDNPWKCSCHLLSSLSQISRYHCGASCHKPKLECQEGEFKMDSQVVLKKCLAALDDIEKDAKMSRVKHNENPFSDEDLSEEVRSQDDVRLVVIPGIALIILVPIMAVVARKIYLKRRKLREKWCNCLAPETSAAEASHNSLSPWKSNANQAIHKDSDSETEL